MKQFSLKKIKSALSSKSNQASDVQSFKVRQVLPELPDFALSSSSSLAGSGGSKGPPGFSWFNVRQLMFQNPRPALCVAAGLAALLGIGFMSTNKQKGLVAHEWGTFTSVQGFDGAMLEWRPLESSRLPKFVYDWNNPGLNRVPIGGLAYGRKNAMLTLQRMETPVIYFYADKKRMVDVSVKFPQGTITEWYPQAAQIGPSRLRSTPLLAKLDAVAHKAGANPDFNLESMISHAPTKESRACWAHLEVLPANAHPDLASLLRVDRSGSHYFAARQTDADFVRVASQNPTNASPDLEKFIFYRGVGNFSAPLRVTMQENFVTVSNSAAEPLEHLFVLGMDQSAGNYLYVERLAPGEQQTLNLQKMDSPVTVEKLSVKLGSSMEKALVSQGLYRREAKAMVNTWQDSWFSENGLRVLYVLPRAWTDRTLPLAMDPVPAEVVRVMVGRAEVLSSKVQQNLTRSLIKAGEGDAEAKAEVVTQLRQLGRFAEPALRLATKATSSQVSQAGWALLYTASKQESKTL